MHSMHDKLDWVEKFIVAGRSVSRAAREEHERWAAPAVAVLIVNRRWLLDGILWAALLAWKDTSMRSQTHC